MRFPLRKGVLGLVKHALGLVEADVLHAQQLEQLEEGLAVMAKGPGAGVGMGLPHHPVAGSSRRCWMSWYFTARSAHSLQLGVLPQWKPMKVSVSW